MSENKVFDPMCGTVAEGGGGGLPDGQYEGEFANAEYLPEQPPDAMTGEGGRQWAKIVFQWKILKGDHAGEYATRETPHSQGPKGAYTQVCGWVVGKTLTAKDKFDLRPFVGRKYLLTVGAKADKNGNPTAWRHVSNAMLMP